MKKEEEEKEDEERIQFSPANQNNNRDKEILLETECKISTGARQIRTKLKSDPLQMLPCMYSTYILQSVSIIHIVSTHTFCHWQEKSPSS